MSPVMRRVLTFALVPAAVAAVYACAADSGTGPGGNNARTVTFSVSTSGSGTITADGAAFASAPFMNGVLVASGHDTLKIDSVRMVLAHVTLFRNDTTCGDEDHDDMRDTACAPIRMGPSIVSLPLDTGLKQVFAVKVPKGTYSGIAMRVHVPTSNPSDTASASFLKANPDWMNVSVRVDGTFDGKPVHWSGAPSIPLREFFRPPVVVSDTSGINFTLKVRLNMWFKSDDGSLMNPNTLTPDQQDRVLHNIRQSLHAFDDDHDRGDDDGEHDH